MKLVPQDEYIKCVCRMYLLARKLANRPERTQREIGCALLEDIELLMGNLRENGLLDE